MKYFSLSFVLTPEDYESYEKKMFFASNLVRLRRLLIPFIFVAILGAIYDVMLSILSAVIVLFSSLILPNLVNREFSSVTRKNSVLMKRPIIVDFYSDHFEVRNEPDGIMKGKSEKHYGFDTVVSVTESDEYFYFIFRTNNILIIPKKVLTEESFGMIKNLIDNLFSKIYRKI